MIDFEQATKDGDQAWDVAVFLYYSGTIFNRSTATLKLKPSQKHS